MIQLHPQLEGAFLPLCQKQESLWVRGSLWLSQSWWCWAGSECSSHHEAAATLSPQQHTPPTPFLLPIHGNWGHLHTMQLKPPHQTCSFVSCVDSEILLPFFLVRKMKSSDFPTEGENLAGCSLLQDKDINWCQTRRWQHINLWYKPPWVATTP